MTWGKCVRNCWRPLWLDTGCPEWNVSSTYSRQLACLQIHEFLKPDSQKYWQSRRSNTRLVRSSTRTKLKVVDCYVFLTFSLKRGFSNCSTHATNGTPKRYLRGLNQNLVIKKGMKIFNPEWNLNCHLNEKHQLDAVNKYIFHLCSVSTCYSCYSGHAWLHHPNGLRLYTRELLPRIHISLFSSGIITTVLRSDTICWFVHFIDLLMMGNVLPETFRDWT